MRNIVLVVGISAIAISSIVYAGKWYEGGDLSDKDNISWQEADRANRLATAASSIAGLYIGGMLKEEISASITNMDAMKSFASELVKCIDTATKAGFNGVRVNYTDLALGCIVQMNWIKS